MADTPKKIFMPITIPKGVPIRGILKEMLAIDCVKVGQHECVVVLPRGIEVQFVLPVDGYCEASKKDEAQAIAYLNKIHTGHDVPQVPPEVHPEP